MTFARPKDKHDRTVLRHLSQYDRFSHNAFSATVIRFVFTQLRCFPRLRPSITVYDIVKANHNVCHHLFVCCSIAAHASSGYDTKLRTIILARYTVFCKTDNIYLDTW